MRRATGRVRRAGEGLRGSSVLARTRGEDVRRRGRRARGFEASRRSGRRVEVPRHSTRLGQNEKPTSAPKISAECGSLGAVGRQTVRSDTSGPPTFVARVPAVCRWSMKLAPLTGAVRGPLRAAPHVRHAARRALPTPLVVAPRFAAPSTRRRHPPRRLPQTGTHADAGARFPLAPRRRRAHPTRPPSSIPSTRPRVARPP